MLASDVYSHDIVIHEVAMADWEVSLTETLHAHMLVECDGTISPVDIEFNMGGCATLRLDEEKSVAE